MKTLKFILLLNLGLLGLLQSTLLKAQKQDSLRLDFKDSVKVVLKRQFSPALAAMYSTIMPGMGQAYNRKYWKMPIIYGLGATLGYFIYWNNNEYLLFKDSYLAKVNKTSNDPFPNISQDVVLLNRDYFKRNREYLIIISTLTFALNILDATVDAHFKSFDISEDLSLKIKPGFDQVQSRPLCGLKLLIQFK